MITKHLGTDSATNVEQAGLYAACAWYQPGQAKRRCAAYSTAENMTHLHATFHLSLNSISLPFSLWDNSVTSEPISFRPCEKTG